MINGINTKQNKPALNVTSRTKRTHTNQRLTNRVRMQVKVNPALVAHHKIAESINKDEY